MKGMNIPIMKKIFYTYLIFLMFGIACVTVHASAFNCEIKSERTDGNITVLGNTGLSRKENLFLMVVDKDEKYDDLRTENFSQKIYSATWCSTDVKGNFETVMKLRSEYGTGTYKCIVFTTGGERKEQLFEYYSPLDIVNALKELSGYTLEQKHEFVEKILQSGDILGIDTTKFEEDGFPQEKLAEVMINMRTSAYKSELQFRDDFQLVLAMLQLNAITDAEEKDAFIGTYQNDLKVDKRYVEADKKIRIKVCERILNKDFDLPTKMQAFILDQLTLEEFLNAQYWNEYQELYNQYKDVILLSSVYQKKLEKTDAVKVFKRMYEKKTTFTETSEITKSLQTAIDYNNSTDTSGKGSGATGGGSKSGSNSVVNLPPVLSPTQDNEPNVENAFNDLTGYEWAQNAIVYLKDKNIVSGYKDNTFRPYGKIKREEFVKMLVCLIDAQETTDISNMKDVIEGTWYYDYISRAAAAGIVNGISIDQFGIGMEITRQEMAVMVCRACKLTRSDKEIKKFNDADDIADYAKSSVEALYERGILSGDDNFNFNPKNHANRAEAAKILYMLMQQI